MPSPLNLLNIASSELHMSIAEKQLNLSTPQGPTFSQYIEQAQKIEQVEKQNLFGVSSETVLSTPQEQDEFKEKIEDFGESALLVHGLQKLIQRAQQPDMDQKEGVWVLDEVSRSQLQPLLAAAGVPEQDTDVFLQEYQDTEGQVSLAAVLRKLEKTITTSLEEPLTVTASETYIPLISTLLESMGVDVEKVAQLTEKSVDDFGSFDLNILAHELENIDAESTPGDITLSPWQTEQIETMLLEAGLPSNELNTFFPKVDPTTIWNDEGSTRAFLQGVHPEYKIDIDALKEIVQETVSIVQGSSPTVNLDSFLTQFEGVLAQSSLSSEYSPWQPIVSKALMSVFQELSALVPSVGSEELERFVGDSTAAGVYASQGKEKVQTVFDQSRNGDLLPLQSQVPSAKDSVIWFVQHFDTVLAQVDREVKALQALTSIGPEMSLAAGDQGRLATLLEQLGVAPNGPLQPDGRNSLRGEGEPLSLQVSSVVNQPELVSRLAHLFMDSKNNVLQGEPLSLQVSSVGNQPELVSRLAHLFMEPQNNVLQGGRENGIKSQNALKSLSEEFLVREGDVSVKSVGFLEKYAKNFLGKETGRDSSFVSDTLELFQDNAKLIESNITGQGFDMKSTAETAGVQAMELSHAPSRHLPEPLQRLAYEQISANVLKALQQSQHKVTMTLYPKELGEVSVDIHLKDNHVSLSFLMESSSVKDVLQSHLQEFKHSMEQRGFVVTGCDVSVGQGNGDRSFERRFASEKRESWMESAHKSDEQKFAREAVWKPNVASSNGSIDTIV